MPKKGKHFVKLLDEKVSMSISATVLVDTVTGVNYLQVVNGYGGGLTPLLDREGKPIISALPIVEE